MIKKALYIAFTSCFLTSHLESTVAVGDPAAAPGTTFSFNVGFAKYSQSENRSRLWLASGQTITNDIAKPYALSYIDQLTAEPIANPATGQQYFPTAWPMANPEGAFIFFYNQATKLVETTNIPNPIYGAEFAFFDIFSNKPLFVMTSDLSKLYYGYEIDHPPVEAAQRFNKTELLLYDLGAGQTIAALLGASDGIYTAYSSGTFGTNTSNIAKLVQGAQSQPDSQKPLPYLQMLATEQVSTNTPALTNNGPDLASLGSNVTLHNFATMTYAGVQARANNGGATATGVMIVNTVLTNTTYSLTFTPIAESSVISASFNTVISAPTNQSIRIKNISAMTTSTSLNYLIVARDNGVGPQAIYAAPLVSKPGEGYGQIADFTQIANTFGTNPPSFFQRYFDTPLTNPAQIQIGGAYAEQITVGGGTIPLAHGNIENLYTVGDSVYIVIGSPYATGTQPGTFRSQAIFAQDGHIISWTPWARVLGSDNPMLYSSVSNTSTSNFYVSDPTGAGTTFNTVVQTQWTAYQNLSTMFQYSAGAQGGIQGIFNFGQSTPGFNNAMSLLTTTGFNNVTIGQTGAISGGNFQILNMNTSDVVSFNNINNSQALVALELAHNGANHWLFTGGVTGLHVLTDNTTGCTKNGNFTSVTNFNAGQTWKQVGDFSYIKKLVWDETFLYVLTPTAIYQIALDPNKFTENPTVALSPVTIISSSNLSRNPYFLDLIIDRGFCIVGTTQGLYSFSTTSGAATNITNIAIPDGLAAVSQLLAISNNAIPQSNFKTTSNLFVLNNSFGTQQTRLNRFSITNETIEPFNDAILNNNTNPNGIPTSFIKFNQYVSNYFTDGSWNLASNYFLGVTQPKGVQSPSLLQIYGGVKNGQSSSHIILHVSSAYVPVQFLKQTNMFLGIACESTSGAYIASGNFPARINA